MINFDLIQAGIVIGSSPNSDDDVARLTQLKMTAVINLQSDADLLERNIDWSAMSESYESADISVYRYPISDFDEVDLANKIVAPIRKLHELRIAKEKVYICCNAGVSRSPSVVLGYLCHAEGMSVAGGLSQIQIARPLASPYKSVVKQALVELSEAAESPNSD